MRTVCRTELNYKFFRSSLKCFTENNRYDKAIKDAMTSDGKDVTSGPTDTTPTNGGGSGGSDPGSGGSGSGSGSGSGTNGTLPGAGSGGGQTQQCFESRLVNLGDSGYIDGELWTRDSIRVADVLKEVRDFEFPYPPEAWFS